MAAREEEFEDRRSIVCLNLRCPREEFFAAAVIHVENDGTGDFTTLEAAVTASAEGIRIVVSPGTYRASEVDEAGIQVEQFMCGREDQL